MLIGTCPDCGRIARLGKLVGERYAVGTDGLPHEETVPRDEQRRCMDCCFGPPMCLWKTCPECGAQTPSVSSCEVCQAAGLIQKEEETSRPHRQTRVSFKRIGLWLQAWCLRSYVADTHTWCAKMERLNSLKVTSRQVLRTTEDVRSLSKRL